MTYSLPQMNFRSLFFLIVLGLTSINGFAQSTLHGAFSASKTLLCGPDCISFTDKSTGNPISWYWSFPGATPSTSTDQNPANICYPANGTYSVSLVISDTFGYNQTIQSPKYINVGVNAGKLNAQHDTICAGSSIALGLDSNSTLSLQWQFSYTGNNNDFTNIPSFSSLNYVDTTFNQTTFIRVISVVPQCPDTTDILKLFVLPVSINSFTDSISGLQVAFTGSTSYPSKSYEWNFGDGSTSTELSPTHTYSSGNIYHPCFRATTNDGCASKISCQDISIGSGSHCQAYFTVYPDTLVPHHWFIVPAIEGKAPIQLAWTWGDGANGIGDTASHVYAAPGLYDICLTITDDTSCTSTFCNSSVSLFREDESNTVVKVNVVENTASGINSPQVNAGLNNIVVMPNPCSTCVVKGIEDIKDIIVTDILGRNVAASITKTGNGFTLNLSANDTGMLLLHNRKTGQVVKFIKDKP